MLYFLIYKENFKKAIKHFILYIFIFLVVPYTCDLIYQIKNQ